MKNDWVYVAQDTAQWLTVVKVSLNLLIQQNSGEFLRQRHKKDLVIDRRSLSVSRSVSIKSLSIHPYTCSRIT